jgi:two-component system, chemotaxis family, sensor kinase CheA
MSSKLIDQVAGTFHDEARERLAELESTLLEMEKTPDDPELVARAFRALHTLKGNGRMFGFDEMAAFAHEIETVFDLVRKGKLAASHKLIGLALSSIDLIASMVEGKAVDSSLRERLLTAFQELLPTAESASGAPTPPPPPLGAQIPPTPATEPPPGPCPARRYSIHFEPHQNLFRDGTNPLGIWDELRGLGSCVVTADTSRVPLFDDLDPEACYLDWNIVLTTSQEKAALRDPFLFVEDSSKLEIRQIEDGQSPPLSDERCLDQFPVGSTDAGQSKAEAVPAITQAAVPKQQEAKDVRPQSTASPKAESASVRVAASKLDQLVDLVGELVTSQARLAQAANVRNDEELRAIAENLERLSSELRDNTLEMRMVPIGTTFSRFMRLVRDLSSELGKDIGLLTEGAETELDKTVIERIGDPLVHLIRNCCDHGVESPAERRAKGKPERGTVRLSAHHSGDSVIIDVADDGAGLSVEAIRAKGLERGLISPDAKLTEREIFNLIFMPGFSTAKAITDVSGRGVGMDVVKRSVESLRGSVEIESRFGIGTTIRLRLPLTLAIIEGLLVTVGDVFYVLPMSSIEACTELTGNDIAHAHGNHVIDVRGELVPYVRLREWFGTEGARPGIEQIAIVNSNGQRVGLVVDQVVGQHQTVLKGLGKTFKSTQELSGATILGDGHVALVVDVNTLAKSAQSQ